MDACTVTAHGAITAFAVPNPGGHLATPSVFSGPAIQRVAPSEPDHPAYFRLTTFSFASPFLPSTCVILIQQWKLSTPKVGANAVYFGVGIFSFKMHKTRRFPLSTAVIRNQFTSFSQNGRGETLSLQEPQLLLDESAGLKHLVTREFNA